MREQQLLVEQNRQLQSNFNYRFMYSGTTVPHSPKKKKKGYERLVALQMTTRE